LTYGPAPRRYERSGGFLSADRQAPAGPWASTVVAAAEDLGLPLRNESWGLSDDSMRLYGALDFDPIARLRMPEGTGPSLGIRHANDKSISVQLTAGARLW
jgi:hypothetical protein